MLREERIIEMKGEPTKWESAAVSLYIPAEGPVSKPQKDPVQQEQHDSNIGKGLL